MLVSPLIGQLMSFALSPYWTRDGSDGTNPFPGIVQSRCGVIGFGSSWILNQFGVIG